MSFIIFIFNEFLYRPLLNVLVLLCEYIPGADFGFAIIILTIFIKLIFYPLGTKAIKSQKALTDIQPKIKEIQEKYKDDKEKQGKELLDLYKREKINPLSGFLPILIQLPVLIAVYRVFWKGFNQEQLSLLYSFVPNPGEISPMFLGFIDLSKTNITMAILVGIIQFLQLKFLSPKKEKNKSNDLSEKLQKQMQYFMPVFVVMIVWSLPSAISLYFLVTTIFTIIQQYIIIKKSYVKPE